MVENQISNESPSNEITLREIVLLTKETFRYLKSKWKVIILTGILGGALGFFYAYLQKPLYTASLTFALEDEKNSGGGLGGALGIATSLGIDLGTSAGGAFSGSNLIKVMESRRMVEQTLLNKTTIDGNVTTLAERYLMIEKWRKEWDSKKPGFSQKIHYPPTGDRNNFSLQQDSILGLMYENILKYNLKVNQKDKKVSIISIDVKSKDELFSKYFAEILAKEVSDFYIETKSKKAKTNVAILEKQSDSVRNELYSAITGVAVANDNTYNLNPALNVNRTPSARRQVDVQANTAILTQMVTNLELARVALRKETPLIQIIDKPILPLHKEKTSKMIFAFTTALIACFMLVIILLLRRWIRKIVVQANV